MERQKVEWKRQEEAEIGTEVNKELGEVVFILHAEYGDFAS